MSKGSISPTSFAFYAIALATSAYLVKYYVDSSWHFQLPLYHQDFDQVAKMIRKEVPTTYYRPGKLHEVLPTWHPDPNSHIHLYRIAPGEKFSFDLSKVENVSVVSKKMSLENCSRLESSLCAGCESTKEKRALTIGEIMSRKYGSDYFSSFTKLKVSDLKKNEGLELTENVATSKIEENFYDKLFPFAVGHYELLHAFVSNFAYSKLSTSIHCNALAASSAIQLVGSKSWLFYPPQVYLGKDYLNSKPAKLSHFPTHSPRKDYEVYVYTSQPGDILFFTNNWAHSVYSHEGPNYMVNYRKLPGFSDIKDYPLAFLHMLGHFLLSPGLETSADINVKAKVLTSWACEGRLSHWDQQQVDILKAEPSGANRS